MIVDKNKCTGCFMCANVCPKKCITMKQDKEGFYYPEIDLKECINCGLCRSKCPSLKTEEKLKISKIYALKNKDEIIRENSSSGGLFYELAHLILSNKGIVVGAAFNKNFVVTHQSIEKLEDIDKLMTSKYVQSKPETIYKEVKKYLDKDKYVLFSGTSCQVAALKSFLNKTYEKLICVDFICHGVPSPKVFKKYKDYILNKINNNNITKINFRNKTHGWKKFSLQIKTENHEYCKLLTEDSYMRGFLENLYLRPSCYECLYKEKSSGADITMADAWGIEEVNNKFYDTKGVSLAIIYTENGLNIFNQIKDKFELSNFEYDNIVKYNSCIKYPSKPHKNRSKFFKKLDSTKDVKKLIDSCLNDRILTKIKRKLKKMYSKVVELKASTIYFFKSFRVPFKVLSIEESLDYIIEHNSSVVRFGDGELAIIQGENIGFQEKNEELANRLKEVLESNEENLLVCIPGVFSSLKAHTKSAQKFWKINLMKTRKYWYNLCKNDFYLNAFISRPYIEIKNKENSKVYFEKISLLYKDKDVVLVEGKYSRLGVGNDLFKNVKSLKRILCPTKNAFLKYDEILKEVSKVSKDKLILLSLGPTAKVLAYDLYKKGYHVLDIGHIDLEYEWYLKKATKKIQIKNKFVNEVEEKSHLDELNDQKYKKEIIKEI